MSRRGQIKRRRLEKQVSLHHTINPSDEEVEEEINVADKSISIQLISSEIFKHLPIQDILNCSLVNKIWNYSSRFYLREDQICYAYIYGGRPCQDIKELNKVIANSWNIPFNGLYVSNESPADDDDDDECLKDCHKCISYRRTDVTNLCPALLTGVRVKYLHVNWEKEPKLSCPAVKLVKQILTQKAANIVGLTVENLPKSDKSFAKYFDVEGEENLRNWLPNVRVLELPEKRWNWFSNPTSLVTELLKATPKLECIKGCVSLEFLPTILRLNKSHAVQEFALEAMKIGRGLRGIIMMMLGNDEEENEYNEFDYEELFEMATTFSNKQPKLGKFLISTSFLAVALSDWGGLANLINKVSITSTSLLRSSCKVLNELCISHLDLILFSSLLEQQQTEQQTSQSGFPAMRRLTRLTIDYNGAIDESEHFSTLSHINFDLIFPYLTTVEVNCERFSTARQDIYISEAFKRSKVDFSCRSVTTLVFNSEPKGLSVDIWMSYFSRLFPNVKNLAMDYCTNFEDCCNALWTAWPLLELLRFTGVEDSVIKKNLDHCFTGLTRKDCGKLYKTKNCDFNKFKRMQCRPSLLNLTKLKKFQIEVDHMTECGKNKNLKKVFLSKLTGQFVLERMQGLSLEIDRDCCTCDAKVKCCFALDHLQPYVKFVMGFENE